MTSLGDSGLVRSAGFLVASFASFLLFSLPYIIYIA